MPFGYVAAGIVVANVVSSATGGSGSGIYDITGSKDLAKIGNIYAAGVGIYTGLSAMGVFNASSGMLTEADAASLANSGMSDQAMTTVAQNVANGSMSSAQAGAFSSQVAAGQISSEAATSIATDINSGAVSANDAIQISSQANVIKAGGTPTGLGDKALAYMKTAQGINTIASILTTGAGAAYSSGVSGQIGQTAMTGAQKAADIVATADLQAAAQQSQAAKDASAQQIAGGQAAKTDISGAATQQTALAQPYMSAGTSALSRLSEGLKTGGEFNQPFKMEESPQYKFALEQGMQAIEGKAAKGGTQLSSGNLAAMTGYAVGEAGQFEQQAFSQWLASKNLDIGTLQNMVRTGQVSSQQLAQELGQAGVSQATIDQYIGNVGAAGTVGAAAATAKGITGAAEAQAAGTAGVTKAQTDMMQQQGAIRGGAGTDILGKIPSVIQGLSSSTPASTPQAPGTTPMSNLPAPGTMNTTPMSAGVVDSSGGFDAFGNPIGGVTDNTGNYSG
jgi:hypothetical protein